MELWTSERLIVRMETGGGQMVLTTHRVCHGNKATFTSIMLEDVCSVVVARMAHRWLLFIMGACIAAAAYLLWIALRGSGVVPEEDYRKVASALLFLSALIVIAFHITRFSGVQIASPGASIEIRDGSVISPELRQFVREVENARNERLDSVRVPEPPAGSDTTPQSLTIPARRQRRTG
jgi:hypothetical protein